MSTTHKVVLIKDSRNPKTGYLKLRTTKDRKSTYTSLKFKVQVRNWNADKQYVKSREPDADKINQKIQEVLAEAQINKVHKKQVIKGKSFVKYAEKIVNGITQEGTKRGRQNALGKFKEYLKTLGKEDIAFEQIDIFFVNNFYHGFLMKDVANSTANEYLTIFKYFITHADIHGHYSYSNDPFKTFKRINEKRSHTVLTDEEVKRFFAYKPQKRDYFLVQQAFGFMMYTSGMRISDFITLKWKNFKKIKENYYVEFNMDKTKTLMKTKLTLEALQFLIPFMEDYDKSTVHSYRIFEKKQKNLRKRLKEAIEEESQIELMNFSDLRYELMDKVLDNWGKMMQEEVKKQERKTALQQQIAQMKGDLEFNNHALLSTLGDEVLKLKKKHPDDTITPILRESATYREGHNVKVYFNYRLKRIGKACKIETPVTNHQARHVFAQRLFESGANFHHVSLALGHSSLEITENYREKLVTDEAMDVVQEFSKIMNEGAN